MKYAAIPTVYNGIQFRSRLEARWAAFFDLCDWKWQYEPFDLPGWIPDFLVQTSDGLKLFEVKPLIRQNILIRDVPFDVTSKIETALRAPTRTHLSHGANPCKDIHCRVGEDDWTTFCDNLRYGLMIVGTSPESIWTICHYQGWVPMSQPGANSPILI